MASPFAQQIAIVTGGASGIGRALCIELATRGAAVVVSDINAASATRVAGMLAGQGRRALALPADVTRPADLQRLFDVTLRIFGRLDYAFCNAGIGIVGDLRDITLDQWRQVVEVNFFGMMATADYAYKIMATRRSGHIITTASLAGLIGAPGMTPYATTKAAMVAYTLGLRVEGRALGVKATTLCPSFLDTGIYASAIMANLKPEPEGMHRRLAFPVLPVEPAVRRMLDEVARNRAIVTYPGYAGLLWRLARFSPALMERLSGAMIAGVRAGRGRTAREARHIR